MLVGVKLAPGAREALRKEVATISGATLGVTPKVSAEGKRALADELRNLPAGQVPVAPTTGAAPAAAAATGGAAAGAGAGQAAAAAAGIQAGAAAKERATTASKNLASALEREQKIAFAVALSERAAANATLTLSQSKEAFSDASRIARQSEDFLQTAIVKGNVELRNRAVALANVAAESKASLATRVAELTALEQAAASAAAAGGIPQEQVLADRKLVATAEAIQAAQNAGALAATKLEAARARLRGANAAVKLSEDALNAALATGVPTKIRAAQAANALALSYQKEEVAAVKAAKAEQLHNTQVRGAARGAGSTALSFLGLRGATLAASAQFLAGAAAVALFAKSISSAARLQETLNVFQAVSGATADEMGQVSEAAKALGADLQLPGVSASDAASAMLELSKAGLEVQDSIAGARGVLQLAAAASIGNTEATTLVATSLNAFSLSGEQATHVADAFANAAKNAQGEITDFGVAMQQVAAVSSQVGVSFEDTTALLTILARQGLRGSDAGTSLRTAFLRLVSPTNQAREVIKNLGLQVRDLEGNVRPEIFADFARATANLAPDVRDAFASIIFGQDAIRAATLAGREGIPGLREAQAAINETGTASEIAAAKAEGLSGAVRGLSSNLDTLGSQLGTVVVPALEAVVGILNTGVTSTSGFLATLGEAFDPDNLDPGVVTFVKDLADAVRGMQAAAQGLPVFGQLFGQASTETSKSAEDIREELAEVQKKINDFRENTGLIPTDLLARSAELVALLESRLPEGIRKSNAALEENRAALKASGEQLTGSIKDFGNQQRVAELGGQLKAALALVKQFGIDATTEAGIAVSSNIQDIIAQFESLGPRGAAALRGAAAQLAPVLAESLREAASSFTGLKLQDEGIPSQLRQQIEQLAQFGKPGLNELKKLGADIQESLAAGITENKDKTIQAARQSVRDALAAMDEAVAASVRSAGSNLDSLAADLSRQVGEVIDKMDFGIPKLQRQTIFIELQTNAREAGAALRDARNQGLAGTELDPFIANVQAAQRAFKTFSDTGRASVETLQDALQGLERSMQRRQLRFDLRQAQRDLRDAQNEIVAITQVGEPSESQKRAIQETLDPFREAVAQKQGDIKTFDLSSQIEALQEIQEKAKDAAEKGIQKLVEDFKAGRISADKFEQALNTRLAPILNRVKKDFGKNLGFTFTKNFMDTFDALVNQARLLTGFLTILGDQPGKNVVDPKKTVTEQQKQVDRARQNLAESLKNQKETAKNTEAQVKLLGLILATIKTPNKAPTKAELQQGLRTAEAMKNATLR